MFKFDWDQTKARSNFAKHGVTFQAATIVFDDERAMTGVDDSMNYGEPRDWIVGRSGEALLKVVYTERSNTIRLISARYATRKERAVYQSQNSRG